ncbi:hypothetical protein L596_022999 [Steinernema carpocapsae]|uniref:Uncharacterized protein n=1 Tax=Steinernema carpocapsae TaxID=34508 RepID=A0A4U5MD59_STECR|nr:hypothetical protein L596_022999 [Steinernema carpocapsae]
MCAGFAQLLATTLFAFVFSAVAVVTCQKPASAKAPSEASPSEIPVSDKKEEPPSSSVAPSENVDKSDRKKRDIDEAPFEVLDTEKTDRSNRVSNSNEATRKSSKSERTITEEIVIPIGKTAKDPLPASSMTSRGNLKVKRKSSSSVSSSQQSTVTRSVAFGEVRKVKTLSSISATAPFAEPEPKKYTLTSGGGSDGK